MSELRTQDKRDKLRLLFETVTAGTTLKQTLMAQLRTADAAVANGSFLTSTSEAGGSASFLILSEYSPVVARRLIGELLDLYEARLAELTVDTSDTAVYNAMMTSLVAVRRFHTDFTGIRYGSGYTPT